MREKKKIYAKEIVSVYVAYVMKLCVCIYFFFHGLENGASNAEINAQKDQARSNFQQMISAAVSNAQQQNGEYASNRRRIGSGRIVDNFNAHDNVYAIGMDVRYMRNKLFKEDGKVVKNWKDWKHSEMANQTSDTDNTDAKSDEPEWANCGPIS